MREPDIRCEWGPATGVRCSVQARFAVSFRLGDLRSYCHDHTEASRRLAPSITPLILIRDLRPVAIMLLGIHGALDAPLRRLLAEPADSGAAAVAIDLAEERGYHEGPLPVVERKWLEVARHEHAWLPVREGEPWDRLRLASGAPTRRCTCGVFEAEAAIRPHARSGKTAAIRTIAAARVAAGERVLLVQPEGSRILAADDPFLVGLHDEPDLREDERP